MPAICPDPAKTGEITAKTCLLSLLRQLKGE